MDAIKDLLIKPELIWFLIGLALLLAEFAIPGLVLIFFGAGAWIVALLCLLLNIGLNTQLVIFIITSVLSLLLLRKWITGVFRGHTSGTQELTEDMKEFIGERVIVTAAIGAQLPGKVELHGTDWSATADVAIDAGTAVEIVGKENLTLKVKTL